MSSILEEQFIMDRLSEPSDYVDSYVAFLDMLGFKEQCGKKKLSCAEIKAIFDDIELLRLKCDDGFLRIVIPEGIRKQTTFTVMSDSIVISTPSNDDGLLFILYLCCFIQTSLLCHGILLRGGIAKGEFFKCGNRMFGPAFIEAYNIESSLATYPRVVISDGIIDYLKTQGLFKKLSVHDYVARYKGGEDPIGENIRQIRILVVKSDEDSLCFVDYFNLIVILGLKNDSVTKDKIAKVIQKGLAHQSDRVKLKYQWIDAYYHRSIQKYSLKIPHIREEATNA